MKAALYHRVSTVDQHADAAREELRAAAQRRGLEVVLDVEETGSGARNDRPGLQKVLEAARRRKVDVLLVWKLDRLGRSLLDLLANLEELQRSGCTFIAVTQGLEIGSGGEAASLLLLRMLGAVAEYERDLIRDRTRLGLAAARRRGARLGRRAIEVSDEQLKRAAVLRTAGTPWPTVAGEVGVPERTLRRRLAAAG